MLREKTVNFYLKYLNNNKKEFSRYSSSRVLSFFKCKQSNPVLLIIMTIHFTTLP